MNAIPQSKNPRPRDRVESAAPLRLVEAFLSTNYTAKQGLTLRRYQGEWFDYEDNVYRRLDEEVLCAQIRRYLDKIEVGKTDRDGEPVRGRNGEIAYGKLKVTQRLVTEVLWALPASGGCLVKGQAPCWLNTIGVRPPADEILACKNVLLHVPTRNTCPPTPMFFTTQHIPYAYDPSAEAPKVWRSLLEQYWPGDNESQETLQEIAGYLLLGDKSQEKIFLLVGPPRSGKGTIATGLTALVGEDSVSTPTLAGLGTGFGLSTLLHSRLAIVGDARLSHRSDQAIVVERLLSISGRDRLDIDRKYLPPLKGVNLPTRFLILTNELPRLEDQSGAFASRFIILSLTHSFLGKEQHDLKTALLDELPGILNWALDGFDRLRERGHFRQPAASAEQVRELEELGSPVAAFVREKCVCDPTQWVAAGDLFSAWNLWCQSVGRQNTGTAQSFGRDLRAAFPGLDVARPKGDADSMRKRIYLGIGLSRD